MLETRACRIGLGSRTGRPNDTEHASVAEEEAEAAGRDVDHSESASARSEGVDSNRSAEEAEQVAQAKWEGVVGEAERERGDPPQCRFQLLPLDIGKVVAEDFETGSDAVRFGSTPRLSTVLGKRGNGGEDTLLVELAQSDRFSVQTYRTHEWEEEERETTLVVGLERRRWTMGVMWTGRGGRGRGYRADGGRGRGWSQTGRDRPSAQPALLPLRHSRNSLARVGITPDTASCVIAGLATVRYTSVEQKGKQEGE
ncbi:hypothetical protein BLNAU_9295 [Blattamonas nauphoetae]|uniref:Uncharacterized protein n=1 Tax=Blattamonas nauphoetae TaxID=2049346 RepID=A0ABQ9XWA5_9EUKA|nr:hypothetical protein BLNAU_9295 [Blattamonas nauphoetae]